MTTKTELLNALRREEQRGNALEDKLAAAESALAATKAKLEAARAEGERAGLERAAKECNLVGDDWREAGVELKAFAADYLAKHLRALPTAAERRGIERAAEVAEPWHA